jgi:predicted TIM-barrel fold metal-dependent hydrolase
MRSEVFADWRRAIRQLATCPNVTVKLGGLAMLVAGFAFHERPIPPSSQELAEAWRPYMDACIEDFGASRCMFESNFPVDKAMCSYPVLWNAFKRIAADASPAEKALLFHDVAARVYRL